MTDALKAAIEVCETKTFPPIEDAFDDETVSVPRNAWLSALAVACFYRAEHPADDGEPVTEEWLRSVGFRDRGPNDLCSPRGEKPIWMLTYGNPNNPGNHEWELSFPGCCALLGYDLRDRGAVRRLCQALGIDLKESSQGGTK